MYGALQYIDAFHFDVIATKDEFDKKFPDLIKIKKGDVRHRGVLWSEKPHQKDFCTCESFFFSNSDEYKKANPVAFQCKHLIAAREQMYGVIPN